MPRDILDQLLHDIRVKSRREEKRAKLEAEAAERAEKRRKHQAIREAFDAERFRWIAANGCFRNGCKDIEEFRTWIDKQMERDGRLKG